MSYQPPAPYIPGPGLTPQAPLPPTPPRRSTAMPILIVALVILAGVVAALAFILIGNRADSKVGAAPASPAVAIFDQARGDCKIANDYDVEDAGQTLNITVGPAYMPDDNFTCLIGELRMPDAVLQHISSTRALDGQQTDSWPGYTARWTYHPDDGLQMTIRKA